MTKLRRMIIVSSIIGCILGACYVIFLDRIEQLSWVTLSLWVVGVGVIAGLIEVGVKKLIAKKRKTPKANDRL